jgi:hypothetical protein
MLTALLPGIREFRTCLVTGAILLASGYLLWQQWLPTHLNPDASLTSLLHIAAPTGSLALLLLAAYLVGAIYLAGIETGVDIAHRHTTTARLAPTDHQLGGRLRRTVAPLSEKAAERLMGRAQAFFRNHADAAGTRLSESAFVESVLVDVLWMEGKLVGTDYLTMYTQMRAEGGIRLGVACLTPFLALAIGLSANLPASLWLILSILALTITVVLVVQGFYQYRKAVSFIAHHVADGALLTPTMESLSLQSDPSVLA